MAELPSAACRRTPQGALQHRDYRLYLCSRILGSFGTELQITGVSWHVYQLTGQPFDLGLIGFAQFVPFLAFFLVAGAVADRFPRRRILGLCGLVHTLCALAFYSLTLASTVPFALIFSLLVCLGVARAFQSPAQQALVPLLVPSQHFASAVAWTTAGTQGARIVGPALAGGLLLLGQATVYGVAIVCLALSTLLTWMMRTNTQIVTQERPSWATLLAGWHFIRSRQVLLGIMTLDFCAVLLGGATALLPLYAVDVLQVGAVGFGSLRAMHTVGALVCTLYLTQRPLTQHAGSLLFGTVLLFGVSVMVFGVSTSFWLSLGVLAIMGAADAVSVFIRGYVTQIIPPDHMRGRVSAVNAVCIGASNELGAFESGLTAAWWGVVPAVVGGGLGAMVVTLLCLRLFPQLKALTTLDQDTLIRQYR